MAMNNTHIPCSDKVAQLPYEFPVKSGGTGDPVHGNTFLPHLLPDCANLPIDTDYFVFDLLPPATQNQLPYNLLSAPYSHVKRNVEDFRLGGVVFGEPIKAALLPLGLSGNSATRVQRPVKTKAPGLRGPCRTDVAPTGGGFQRDRTGSTAHCPVPEAAIQPFPVARTVTTGPGAQKIPFSF